MNTYLFYTLDFNPKLLYFVTQIVPALAIGSAFSWQDWNSRGGLCRMWMWGYTQKSVNRYWCHSKIIVNNLKDLLFNVKTVKDEYVLKCKIA